MAARSQDAASRLRTLAAGTLVCFVDASGPLCAARCSDGTAAWVLRSWGGGGAACFTGAQPRSLPPSCLFTVLRSGDALGFRSLGCEGRTLQACSRTGALRLANDNFGSWERWAPNDTHGLVNQRWGRPLGLGLTVVCASLWAEVKAVAAFAADEIKVLRAAAAAAEARSEAMARAASAAEASARAEQGRGWHSLQSQLEASNAERVKAVASARRAVADAEQAERRAKECEAATHQAQCQAKAAESCASEATTAVRKAEARLAAATAQVESQAMLLKAIPEERRGGGGAMTLTAAVRSQHATASLPRGSQHPVWCASPALPLSKLAPARAAAPPPPPPADSAASSEAESDPEHVRRARTAAAASRREERRQRTDVRAHPPKGAAAAVAPLGARAVLASVDTNENLFLGMWQNCQGGVTPAPPRMAAVNAAPRLAGWRQPGPFDFV